MHYSKTCAYDGCAKEFTAKNARQLYCSSTCKQYNSNAKKGKLNATQQAVINGDITVVAPPKINNRNNGNNKLSSQLLLSYLNGLFGVTGKYGLDYKDSEEEFLEPMAVLEDDVYGVERVSETSKGHFLIQSVCKTAILDIKNIYNGSNIFKGSTGIQINKNIKVFGEPRRDRFTVYATILPREKVIEIGKIPVDMI